MIDVEERRKAADFVTIPEDRRPKEPTPPREGPAPYWEKNNPPREPERVERNCAACQHLGDFDDEGRRGFCIWLRGMKSTWHPVLCNAFIQKTWERRTKFDWKGIVYE